MRGGSSKIGCVALVSRRRALSGQGINGGFELEDLEQPPPSLYPNLRPGGGLVGEVVFADPTRNAAVPNLEQLYAEKRAERSDIPAAEHLDSQSRPTMVSTEFWTYPDRTELTAAVFATETDALHSINRSLRRYLDQRYGPTVLIVQSSQPMAELMRKGIPSLRDFPILSVASNKKDNAIPATRLAHYSGEAHNRPHAHHRQLASRSCRVGPLPNVPIGSLGNDSPIFVSNLQFARRLQKADVVL
ncbi:hypothetical protein HK405_001451 [Cladochytrium tenue]|nr:hypothetical protein HK405_001451 [Cladochytrium tenue]